MQNKKEPNATDVHVGARIRMRRLMLGMSQERLGTALGITFQQVQKYEKGSNRVGAGRLQDIARILEVPPSFFFEGLETQASAVVEPEPAGTADTVTDFLATSEGVELNSAFARIADQKLRRKLLLLVGSLASADDAPVERD